MKPSITLSVENGQLFATKSEVSGSFRTIPISRSAQGVEALILLASPGTRAGLCEGTRAKAKPCSLCKGSFVVAFPDPSAQMGVRLRACSCLTEKPLPAVQVLPEAKRRAMPGSWTTQERAERNKRRDLDLSLEDIGL